MKLKIAIGWTVLLLLASCSGQAATGLPEGETEGGGKVQAETGKQAAAEEVPNFKNASVHDPSVIKVDDTYYVFGFHLAAAKTTDFVNWTQNRFGSKKTEIHGSRT